MARGWEMDQGAQPTFDELYRQCGARVYGYCWRLCDGNETEAQDLAQETFVRAYRGLDHFEGRSSVLTWRFQIPRHERIRGRKKAREGVSLDAPGVRERGHDPTAEQERRLWLNTALQRLPDQLRDALILVKCEGLTHREAAEVLGIPQGTVQFHVHQAMKQMRVLLNEQFGLPLAVALLLSLYLQRSAAAEPVPPGLTERVY
ncbi:MAG: RNA polymerase sigma factor, partial [Actinomycetota bacterium]